MVSFKLIGEEYLSDGVWSHCTITEGTKEHCIHIFSILNGGEYKNIDLVEDDTNKEDYLSSARLSSQ